MTDEIDSLYASEDGVLVKKSVIYEFIGRSATVPQTDEINIPHGY